MDNTALLTEQILDSWLTRDSEVCSNQEIIAWIARKNQETEVEIDITNLSLCDPWFYDAELGSIHNHSNSFFQVEAVRYLCDDSVLAEQPILIQDEIGFLGIIAKPIDGVLHFLMQAKIEPGNLNHIQLSPTIQATKSNFTQKHGGRKPQFLEYFTDLSGSTVVYDQIQSEQSSRFLGKRNRNIVILTDQMIPTSDSHRWMTLGQIKELLKTDNLVNMDTRTVLSGLPIWPDSLDGEAISRLPQELASSMLPSGQSSLVAVRHAINDHKMMDEGKVVRIGLEDLEDWTMSDTSIEDETSSFKVIYCDIKIEGREVAQWKQPLFAAKDIARFVLAFTIKDRTVRFLTKLTAEIGCFDKVELGPSLSQESRSDHVGDSNTTVDLSILHAIETGRGVHRKVLLSEEGGRFYHEENENVIIQIPPEMAESFELDASYHWLTYWELLQLMQTNNVLNIQLRNLLTLIDVDMFGAIDG